MARAQPKPRPTPQAAKSSSFFKVLKIFFTFFVVFIFSAVGVFLYQGIPKQKDSVIIPHASLSKHVNKSIVDWYKNSYKITEIYHRNFLSYTWDNQPGSFLLQRSLV